MNKKRLIREAGCCNYCGSREGLTIDHIVPVSIMTRFGFSPHEPENLQVLCVTCNTEKGAYLKTNCPQTILLIKKMLQRWLFLHEKTQQKRHYVWKHLAVVSQTPNPTYLKVLTPKEELEQIYWRQHSKYN